MLFYCVLGGCVVGYAGMASWRELISPPDIDASVSITVKGD